MASNHVVTLFFDVRQIGRKGLTYILIFRITHGNMKGIILSCVCVFAVRTPQFCCHLLLS